MLHKIKKDLPEAAKRSLTEATERRKMAKKNKLPKELGGRNGQNPHATAIGRKKELFPIFEFN